MNQYKIGVIGILMLFCQFASSQIDTTVIDRIPFRLTDHNNLSVKATLNEKDTLELMFHTAASSLSIIKDAADKTPSILWSESEDVESWGGRSESRFSENNTLQIGTFNKDSINT